MSKLSRDTLAKITRNLRDRQKAVLEAVRTEYDQRDNQQLIELRA
jgi:hypothetical protein